MTSRIKIAGFDWTRKRAVSFVIGRFTNTRDSQWALSPHFTHPTRSERLLTFYILIFYILSYWGQPILVLVHRDAPMLKFVISSMKRRGFRESLWFTKITFTVCFPKRNPPKTGISQLLIFNYLKNSRYIIMYIRLVVQTVWGVWGVSKIMCSELIDIMQ